MQLTTAQRRRWAMDLRANYPDNLKATAHADEIMAEADLEDAMADRDPAMADICIITQEVPILGRISLQGGRITDVEHPYNTEIADYCEICGIYTAWDWLSDPAHGLEAGQLCRIYIGSRERGPEAQYDVDNKQWYALTSKGNYGKRYACGGNWRGIKADNPPDIYNRLQEVIMDYVKIKQAEARLAAAKLRVWAAHQEDMAAAYNRQASRPIYAGQEIICTGKANVVMALAAETRAQADLIEAKAGA
jgi:hypothetical protein